MKKLFLVIVFLTLGFSETIHHEIDTKTSYKEALALGKAQKKDIIVFSYTDYCPWCDRMKRYTLEDFEVINLIAGEYIFASVHRDEGDLPKKLISKYVPMTFVVSYKDESIKKILGGYKSPQEYIKELQ